MNDAEKKLIKDVMWFYRHKLSLPPSGLGPGSVAFAETPDTYEYEPTGVFTLNRAKALKAAAYGALASLLAALAVFALAGWYDPANMLFFALVCGLCYFLPVFLATVRQRSMTIYYGPYAERELACGIALAYFNSNLVRDFLHATLDALTLPLLLSLQHGLALWFARAYFASRGESCDLGHTSLRARNGMRLVSLLGRMSRGTLPRFLLRFG